MSGELVLVTGGSGFVGVHCIAQLLQAGYRVRTTVRSLSREADVRDMLQVAGVDPGERLTFIAADLLVDAGWADAVSGCAYVLHVASPFPLNAPKHEDEVIRPAREGTLRVLRAARDAKVKRVVLTSSFAAIGYGQPDGKTMFDERDWTNAGAPGLAAYAKSKTLAERAAWNFIKTEGGTLELATVNPVGIFGPALGPDYSTSIRIVKLLLDRALPGLPRLWAGAVDVRDVADLHLRAMTDPAARGERFLAVAGDFMALRDLALILKNGLGPLGARVPTRTIPDWAVRIMAFFSKSAAAAVPELGKPKNATSGKAIRLLGWQPRPASEAILASAQSLIMHGLTGK